MPRTLHAVVSSQLSPEYTVGHIVNKYKPKLVKNVIIIFLTLLDIFLPVDVQDLIAIPSQIPV